MSTSARPPRQILLGLVSSLTRPLIYGVAVTLLLALHYTLWKVGDVKALPKMLHFVSLQFTPWFMLAYHVAAKVLPDLQVRRAANLLLPAVEGVAAVVVMAVLLALRIEFESPYVNTAWVFIELVLSVLAARLWVRRTFRH